MASKANASNEPLGQQPLAQDGAANTHPDDSPGPTLLEMRQVAGLTAGSVMDLHKGSFQFRESDREVGFSLYVDSPDDVVVVVGAAEAVIDEVPVTEPTPLGLSVLNVGSACFTVREPRPDSNTGSLVEWLEAAKRPTRAITVPDFSSDQGQPTQATSTRFGSLFSKEPDEAQPALNAEHWEFLESIRDARSLLAERHRHLHPNPEELRSRLERLDPGLWDRTVDHPLFARFAIAYSTIPWEPRFDQPENIPLPLHQPIQAMSQLPWVPITANLLFGPLGIVGSRSAALACARNAVLSLACTTAPSDIEFSIVTAQGQIEDWNWTGSLPSVLFPSGSKSYAIAVADGISHFEGAGFDHEAVKNNEMGLIVLAESLNDLPDYCGTILLVSNDGHCQITNHLGERIAGTPIGVTSEFAAAAATIVHDAIGDTVTKEPAATPSAAKPLPVPVDEKPEVTEDSVADVDEPAPTDSDNDPRDSDMALEKNAPEKNDHEDGTGRFDDELDSLAAEISALGPAEETQQGLDSTS